MCELFAVSSECPVRLTYELSEFASHGGQRFQNRDGWGIVFSQPRDAYIFKEPSAGATSALEHMVATHPPLSQMVIAHVRRANVEPPLNPDPARALKLERVALFTQQVSHYHAARFRAARAMFDELRIYSWVNSAEFDEFLSLDPESSGAVRTFADYSAYARAVRSGALWKRVHKELDDYGPNVVAIAGWSFPESVAAIAWARHADVGIVLMSASQPHDAARTAWREAIKRRVVSACDAALVAAGPHGDYASHLGIPPDRVFFGYDAVDNDYFAAGAERARMQARGLRALHQLPQRYLLASGRFIEKKNFPRLIEAFARSIAANDRGHHLVILGDGPERSAIEQAIERHGLKGRVQLPGFRSYDVLPDFYALAEGFVHVALAEQWGLVINEAAASSQPLIVSRPCGAATALVREGENGFLIEPQDIAAMARAIGAVMTLRDDDRVSMGNESRRIVADWSPNRYASGLRSACEAAIERPARELSLLDRTLFKTLSHMQISAVS